MGYDLEATVNQTMADKIVDSVKYPFVVFEHRKPFSGFSAYDVAKDVFEDESIVDTEFFLKDTLKYINQSHRSRPVNDQPFENMATEVSDEFHKMLDNYTECLNELKASEEWNRNNPGKEPIKWEGPKRSELNSIIKELKAFTSEGKINNINLFKKLIDVKAMVTWIRVALGKRPTFKLSGSNFKVTAPNILPSGTGEVWVKYKWIKCVKTKWGICYRWKTVTKTKRILKLTLKDVKLDVISSANVLTEGALVKVYAKLNRLRLKYRYLDKIPLENLANQKLSGSPVIIFDASAYIAMVPVLDSSFRVEQISIRNESGKVPILISVTNA